MGIFLLPDLISYRGENARNFNMAANGTDILINSIARNLPAVLSLPSAGILRNHKTRFLVQDSSYFWIESPAGDRPLVEALITMRTPVVISFRTAGQTASFIAPILNRNPEFRLNAQAILDALRLSFPKHVRVAQRRSNYRVRVTRQSQLTLRLWRIPEHFVLTDRPRASLELSTELHDLSIGGAGVFLLPQGDLPPKVIVGERLRISLRYRELNELILEGRLRYLPPPGMSTAIRAGAQFQKLESTLEGRKNLAGLYKIIGELEREETRRTRLGITVA